MTNSKTVNNTNVRNMNVVVNNFLFHVHGAAVRAAYAENEAASDAAFEARCNEIETADAIRRAAADVEWNALMADQRQRIDNMDREFAERVAAMQRDHEARVAAMRNR